MKPTNIKDLQSQSRNLTVRRVDRDTFVVESLSNPRGNHIVTVRFGDANTVYARCTCPWAKNHGVACSHVIAALEYLAGLKGRRLSFWLTQEDANRQKHRTFYLAGGRNRQEGVWITSRTG
ncbi:MAG: SWIM zinc finger family protein [Chloroflexi bacterium]|nr:SWIM zinc finger family protein [Chloroflexota bacterium]